MLPGPPYTNGGIEMSFDPKIKRELYKNCYFKDDGSPRAVASGLLLPIDTDGVVRNKTFEECDLHPLCTNVQFEQCEFIFCDIAENPYWKKHGQFTDCNIQG